MPTCSSVEAAEMFFGLLAGDPTWAGALPVVVAELPDQELFSLHGFLSLAPPSLAPGEREMAGDADCLSDEQFLKFRAKIRDAVEREVVSRRARKPAS